MADTTTSIYGFTQPEVGGSTDTWGTKLNTDLTSVENEIARQRLPFLTPTVGATTTLDLSQTVGARVFAYTNNQVHTLAFSNIPGATFYARWYLKITNGGAFAITYPAAVVWDGGSAPTLETAGVNWIEFVTMDGGAIVYARVLYAPVSSALNPRVSVYHSGTQSPAGAALAFDTERFDVGAMHDNAVNNSRLTVPAGQGGLYHITFHARVVPGDTPPYQFVATIRKNGVTSLRTAGQRFEVANTGVEEASIQLSIHEVLAAGDYLEAIGTATGAGAGDAFGGGITGIGFEAVRVR